MLIPHAIIHCRKRVRERERERERGGRESISSLLLLLAPSSNEFSK
jgi:hypothetical protein